MKVLIFGKKGQLGSKFTKYLDKDNIDFLSLSKEECDITDFLKVRDAIKGFNPDIVINCTAYNFVDKAEEDYLQAFDVNTFAVKNLAVICKELNKFLVHYSTDYVFDGTKQDFYTEEDTPNPLNIYAKSKLSGEVLIKEVLDNYLIFRVSWVYGEGKQNFLYKLQQWASNNDILKIAVDEFSVPTSTKTIVDITMKAIKQGLKGLYHLTNSGYASRYEWAKEYLKIRGIKKLIYPAYQSDFNLPAKRPKWSVMSNSKISKELKVDILPWNEEMKYLEDLQP